MTMSDIPDPTMMTGLEQLRWARDHVDDATTPSIRRLLGMRFEEIENGRVTMALTTSADFANPQGTTHGGIYATILDSVMGCAVHSTLPAGVGYTTLELKVNYVRPVSIDGAPITAEGSVIHAGRRTATAEGRAYDGAGKLVAHASTTCLIINPN